MFQLLLRAFSACSCARGHAWKLNYIYPSMRPQWKMAFKLVTDEQVFYDKFYLPSARVYNNNNNNNILYDKFSYDSFTLLV